MLGLVIGLSALAAWRLPRESFWRAAKAGCLVQLAAFCDAAWRAQLSGRQPASLEHQPTAGSAATQACAARDRRRAGRVGLRTGAARGACSSRLRCGRCSPSGHSPHRRGRRPQHPGIAASAAAGPALWARGSRRLATLVTKSGERLDGSTAALQRRRKPRRAAIVVGFFTTYCRLLPTASHLCGGTITLLPGWSRALMRAFKSRAATSTRCSRTSCSSGAAASSTCAARRWSWLTATTWAWCCCTSTCPTRRCCRRDSTGPGAAWVLTTPTTCAWRLISRRPWRSVVQTGADGAGTPPDHWLREAAVGRDVRQPTGPGRGKAGKSSDQRIPLLISFLNQASATDGLRYDKPLSTTVLRSLTPELLSGRLRSPAALAKLAGSTAQPRRCQRLCRRLRRPRHSLVMAIAAGSRGRR